MKKFNYSNVSVNRTGQRDRLQMFSPFWGRTMTAEGLRNIGLGSNLLYGQNVLVIQERTGRFVM
jgi:hypothetical protein